MKTIKIIVEGGVVIDVENLPPTAAGQKKGQGTGMMNDGGMNKSQEWKKNGGGGGKQ